MLFQLCFIIRLINTVFYIFRGSHIYILKITYLKTIQNHIESLNFLYFCLKFLITSNTTKYRLFFWLLTVCLMTLWNLIMFCRFIYCSLLQLNFMSTMLAIIIWYKIILLITYLKSIHKKSQEESHRIFEIFSFLVPLAAMWKLKIGQRLWLHLYTVPWLCRRHIMPIFCAYWVHEMLVQMSHIFRHTVEYTVTRHKLLYHSRILPRSGNRYKVDGRQMLYVLAETDSTSVRADGYWTFNQSINQSTHRKPS